MRPRAADTTPKHRARHAAPAGAAAPSVVLPAARAARHAKPAAGPAWHRIVPLATAGVLMTFGALASTGALTSPSTAEPGMAQVALAAPSGDAPETSSPNLFDGAAALGLKPSVTRPARPAARVVPAKVAPPKRPVPAAKPVASDLSANGIPAVALNAYRAAAAKMAIDQSWCGIEWSLLAGIGRIETDHGRYGGATLLSDGTSTKRIIGPVLDGTKWARIMDHDGGKYDNDRTFDHAVGPMQFIPSTWATYGSDATGDGVSDPFNINDAALAAARYLCAAGGDVTSDAGRNRAILAYNPNQQYLAAVLILSEAYANGVPINSVTWTPPSGSDDATATPSATPTTKTSARSSAPKPAPGATTTAAPAPTRSSTSSAAPRPPAPTTQPTTTAAPPPPTSSAAPTSPKPTILLCEVWGNCP